MSYNNLCRVLLLSATINTAWAMDYTNPTTSKGKDCVSVETLKVSDTQDRLYNLDVEIIGHCIEKMYVKVCPTFEKRGCEVHVLPKGERIKSRLYSKTEVSDVYYEWAFYETFTITSSQASKPNWNYIESVYLDVDFDFPGQELEATGFGVVGSMLVGENIILVGSYSDISEDDIFDADANQASIGIGFRYGATNSTDVFGIVSYEYVEIETFDFDVDGYGLRLGVRSMFTEFFEGSATIGYVDIEDESEAAFGVSARYHFNKQYSIGVAYATSDDVDSYSVGLKISF